MLGSDGEGVMEEERRRSDGGGGAMEEERWRRKGGVMEEEARWRRSPLGLLLERLGWCVTSLRTALHGTMGRLCCAPVSRKDSLGCADRSSVGLCSGPVRAE